jgi:oligopeptidase A
MSLTSNPLYSYRGLPPFAQITPEHVVPAVTAVLEECRAAFDALEASVEPTWQSVVVAPREALHALDRVWSPVGHLMGVANSPQLRAAHEAMEPAVVEFGLRLGQSEPMYRATVALRDSAGWSELTPAQQRTLEQKILGATLSGIGLQGPARERFNEIAQKLSALQTRFSNNVMDEVQTFGIDITDPARLAGLTPLGRMLLAQAWSRANDGAQADPDNGPWRATLDAPSYMAVLEYAEDRALREQLYRAFATRASSGERDNRPLLVEILQLRREQANLLGYANYAELSLATKMADLDGVNRLSEELRQAALAHAPAELAAVQEFARSNGSSTPLDLWDLTLWRRRLRESEFSYTDDELRPYLPLNRVLDGMFELVGRIFGIEVRAADGKAEVWDADVRFFEVFDGAGAQIAAFYLDPYARPATKRGGAWMGECQSRWPREDGLQLPVAYLTCNQTPPVGEQPSLMTFNEVETLFHEFGHGLHHMLTRVDVPEVAGISGVEWDAVELPSQFMENWCYHRPTLLGMARHWQTGEVLPDHYVEKLRASRNFQAATFLARQLLLGMVDMELHAAWDPSSGTETPNDVKNRVASMTQVMPLLPEDEFLCSFSHIFAGGYSAGYYSYKWAEVLSADAFEAFVEAGLDDEEAVRSVGTRYRDTVLALGGSLPPMVVYEKFRGRQPRPAALLEQYGLAS